MRRLRVEWDVKLSRRRMISLLHDLRRIRFDDQDKWSAQFRHSMNEQLALTRLVQLLGIVQVRSNDSYRLSYLPHQLAQ